ncbi:SPOR domain-containing protein [Alkalihalobacterium sp. APHAB7]|uniref:SPOR domain-containing protein n=1 Tax=Alkalihalobacterium sp. APHAB7 TaxID=3402081 RepID=UPI003AABAE00
MSEWLNNNKNRILYSVLIFFLLLTVFYMYFVRPLQAEERSQQEELHRIQTDIAHYETQISKLTAQSLTPLQKKTLLDRVPMRPNVEQVIADLERTELDTGAVIDSVSISIHPSEAQENEGQDTQSWRNILDEDLYSLLETQVADVNGLHVSYIEMSISMNGKEEDVHSFIEEVEKLKRIIHVQSYDYSLDSETERVQASATLRAFYCEDFLEFIEDAVDFKLDYNFDPSKLNRYIEVSPEISSGSEGLNETGTNGENSSSTTPSDPATSTTEIKLVDPSKRYVEPAAGEQEANLAFYVVQTGGYNTEATLYEQVTNLRNAGMYPREVERENQANETRFVVYTGVAHDKSSAEQLANYLKSVNKDFHSWVDQVPFSVKGNTALAKDAQDLVSSVSPVITKGLTETNYQISSEQMDLISAKIRVYELRAREAMTNSSDMIWNTQLENTLIYTKQLETALKNYQNQNQRSHLWQAQGAMLDFMLTLNGYVSFTEK